MQLQVISIFIFFIFLFIERIFLNQYIRTIPLRISVTGTRGKSSVVRMLAAILREDGRKVLAKTTGSQARTILPSGEEEDVHRRGVPSIMEQKALLRKAAKMKVDCLITEIMSIHPENHFVESQQIVKPDIVIITNVRRDHIAAMGQNLDEIASVFDSDITPGATVFVPETENRQTFSSAAKRENAVLMEATPGMSGKVSGEKLFPDNYDLAYAVAKYLKIDDKTIAAGLGKARYDIGNLNIWLYKNGNGSKQLFLVNGFAINDPDSTLQAVEKIMSLLPGKRNKTVGLFNIRADRGDRTMQWIRVLQKRAGEYFQKIYVMGAHSRIVMRKLPSVRIIKEKAPEEIMGRIFAECENDTVIFGFGNIKGGGEMLVHYWRQAGVEHGI